MKTKTLLQQKTEKCLNCGAILAVPNKNNESYRIINCPQCKAELKVSFLQNIGGSFTDHNATQLSGAASGETQLGDSFIGEETILGSTKYKNIPPKLSVNGVNYSLADGKNIVGRKGLTSQATVQIATDDHYMSRQHCCLTISRLSDGTIKAVLTNYKNKNQTTVNGHKIETGDEIRLCNGDSIVMGHTTMVYSF